MNHAIKAIDHENKIRRWQTFTPPQRTAYAAHCGLVLHWRAYFSRAYAYVGTGMSIQVLKERYIDTFEGAAVIHHRLGAAKLVSGAVKSLVTAAA